MSEIVHIAILSHNEIVREGLRRILDDQGFCVDLVASGPDDIHDAVFGASLIVVDAVDVEDGLASCAPLRERYPGTHIVLMVDEYRLDSVAQAFASGAVDGYLIKQISCGPLGGALRLVAMGEKLVPTQFIESISNPILQPVVRTSNSGFQGLNLSSRELEILCCLVDGDANKVISRRLNIADATVKVHIKAILRKLRVKNRTQAAIWAVSRGFTQSEHSAPQSLVA